jgi:hypothetical protein
VWDQGWTDSVVGTAPAPAERHLRSGRAQLRSSSKTYAFLQI